MGVELSVAKNWLLTAILSSALKEVRLPTFRRPRREQPKTASDGARYVLSPELQQDRCRGPGKREAVGQGHLGELRRMLAGRGTVLTINGSGFGPARQ